MARSEERQERDRYENRLKWQRDLFQYEKDAYEMGRSEEIIRKIHLCQRALKQEPTPPEELTPKPLVDLQRLAEEWEQRLLSRE